MLKPIWAYTNLQNLSEPVQTYSNLSEHIWTYPNLSKFIQNYLNYFFSVAPLNSKTGIKLRTQVG